MFMNLFLSGADERSKKVNKKMRKYLEDIC